MRTADFLLSNRRALCRISTFTLVLFVAAIVLTLIGGGFALNEPQAANNEVALIVGVLLAIVMLFGIIAMVWSTWVVVKHRMHLMDWGLFLTVVWLIPYVGIAILLGAANILEFSRRVRK